MVRWFGVFLIGLASGLWLGAILTSAPGGPAVRHPDPVAPHEPGGNFPAHTPRSGRGTVYHPGQRIDPAGSAQLVFF